MKFRRHHNNKGYRMIKNGTVARQVRAMAKRLGIPYGKAKTFNHHFKKEG